MFEDLDETVRSISVDESQPGLFDLPDAEAPTASSRWPDRSQRGRNRETWSCTATADVTIIDEVAIREGVELAEERGLVIEIGDDPAGEDTADEMLEAQAGNDVLGALAWLIWPTDGLDDLLEAVAFRVDSVDSKVVAESDDSGTLSWTVTVKLTDVEAVRRLAGRLAVRGRPVRSAALDRRDQLAAWRRHHPARASAEPDSVVTTRTEPILPGSRPRVDGTQGSGGTRRVSIRPRNRVRTQGPTAVGSAR